MVSIVVEIPNRKKRVFKVDDADSADSVLATVEQAVRKINAARKPAKSKAESDAALEAAREYLKATENDPEVQAIREECRKLRKDWIRTDD
jgi:hypothetical protein